MQERKVTIGDTTHALPDPFIVLATENPIEHEGTYALPEAELDRFFMKILVSYPTHEEEIEIMKIHANEVMKPIQPFLSAKDLNELHGALNDDIFIDDKVYHYVADLILATRNPRAY
jgi:MoxR-like ATPase